MKVIFSFKTITEICQDQEGWAVKSCPFQGGSKTPQKDVLEYDEIQANTLT